MHSIDEVSAEIAQTFRVSLHFATLLAETSLASPGNFYSYPVHLDDLHEILASVKIRLRQPSSSVLLLQATVAPLLHAFELRRLPVEKTVQWCPSTYTELYRYMEASQAPDPLPVSVVEGVISRSSFSAFLSLSPEDKQATLDDAVNVLRGLRLLSRPSTARMHFFPEMDELSRKLGCESVGIFMQQQRQFLLKVQGFADGAARQLEAAEEESSQLRTGLLEISNGEALIQLGKLAQAEAKAREMFGILEELRPIYHAIISTTAHSSGYKLQVPEPVPELVEFFPSSDQPGFGGFCPVHAVEAGELVPGDIQFGTVRVEPGNFYFCFSSQAALDKFDAHVFSRVKRMCMQNPELLTLTETWKFVTPPKFLNPAARPVSVEDDWQRIKEVQRMANFCNRRTVACQTPLSNFRKDADSQVYLAKDEGINTMVARASGAEKTFSYLVGLRGDDDRHVHTATFVIDRGC